MTYKVGDKVELLTNGGFDICKAGDVGTVTRVGHTGSVYVDGGWIDTDGVEGVFSGVLNFYASELKPYSYVIECPYKVGDRVEIVNAGPYLDVEVGSIGTVIRTSESGRLVGVEGVWDGGVLHFWLGEVKPAVEPVDDDLKYRVTYLEAKLGIERAHLATAQRSIEALRLEKEQALQLETYWRQRASALASSKETYRRRMKRLRVSRDEARAEAEKLKADKATAIMQRDYWEAKSRRLTGGLTEQQKAELLEAQMMKATLEQNGGREFVKLIETLTKLATAGVPVG